MSAQLLGAVAAGWLIRALAGKVGDLGATTPHVAENEAMIVELLLTALLVTVMRNGGILGRGLR